MGFAITNAFIMSNMGRGNSAQLGMLNNNEALYNSIGQAGSPNFSPARASAQEQNNLNQQYQDSTLSQACSTESDSWQKVLKKQIHDSVGFQLGGYA